MVAGLVNELVDKESFDTMAGDSNFGCMNSGVLSASGARRYGVVIVRGARSFFSLMVITIFSRSSGVM